MIRAVLFDFYGVWCPDKFSEYIDEAKNVSPDVVPQLEDALDRYYHGEVDLTYLTDMFRYRLGRADIDLSQLPLDESAVSPQIIDFFRQLHAHFLKLGILANLGSGEYKLLGNLNQHQQLFEVIAGPLPFHLPLPLLNKDVFAQALQAIGEPPRSCLAVSGSQQYRAFAENLGIATLPFEGLPKLKAAIEQRIAIETPGV